MDVRVHVVSRSRGCLACSVGAGSLAVCLLEEMLGTRILPLKYPLGMREASFKGSGPIEWGQGTGWLNLKS